MFRYLVLFLAVLTFVAAEDRATLEETTINVGIPLGLQPLTAPDSLWYIQNDSYVGLMIWQNWWNSLEPSLRTTSYGATLKFNLTVYEHNYRYASNEPNRLFVAELVHNMSIDPNIDFMFPPVGSPWGTQLRKNALADGRAVTIGLQDSRNGWYSVPGSFGAPTSAHKVLSTALPYLRLNKAKTVTVVRTIEPFQSELCDGFIAQAPLNALEISKVINITFPGRSAPADPKNWTIVLDQVQEQDSDILVICDYGIGSEFALATLRERRYTPKAVLLSSLFNAFQDTSLLDYVLLPTGYEPTANYPRQPNFKTSREYNELAIQEWGRPASQVMAYATLSGMLLSDAMVRGADNSSAELISNLGITNLDSFMGAASFDVKRKSLIDSLIIQFLNNEHRVVGPALAAAEDLIYPMPTWEERQSGDRWGHGTEKAAVVLIVLAGLVLIGWTIFVFVNWNHKRIVAASPLFLLVINFGAALVLVSLFSWMPNLVSNAMCNVRPWLLPFGFTTMFGALIVKTHRIHSLYSTKSLKIIVVPNSHVALELLVILAIQAILSILMVTVSGLKSQIHLVDEYRPLYNYATCTFTRTMKILFYLNIVFVALLWAAGSYLAFRVRAIATSAYDESQVIIFAIYNTAIFGIISLIIHFTIGNTNRFLVFMIMVICCILGTLITTCMLFIPKCKHIIKMNSLTMTTSSSGDVESSIHRTTSRNTSSGKRHDYSLKPVAATSHSESRVTSHSESHTAGTHTNEEWALMAKNKSLKKKNRKLTAENLELAEKVRCLKAGIPLEE
jgi:rhodanese-related sulfurtransferase